MIPPDDTGRDTFQRFAYQAHIAFPYCLSCYFERGVLSVTAEHFEDLMVEEQEVLRFLQIKTRDPSRGLWTFAHLVEAGGALHGLLRTHRAMAIVQEDREIRYEIVLEGAGRRNAFEGLRPGGAGPSADHVRRCCEGLRIEENEARDLLARVTVRDGQPLRDVIEARNVDSVIRAAGHVAGETVRRAVSETVELVKTAMLAEIRPRDWIAALTAPDTLEEEAADLFARKRITREQLHPILSVLEGGDAQLLEALTDESFLSATALERKLLSANANDDVIELAKEYRARAAIRLATFRATTLFDTGLVEDDLDQRLLGLARTVASEQGEGGTANSVWGRLHERTHQNPAALDRRRVLEEDPVLLMGQICELSDRCLFDWRPNV